MQVSLVWDPSGRTESILFFASPVPILGQACRDPRNTLLRVMKGRLNRTLSSLLWALKTRRSRESDFCLIFAVSWSIWFNFQILTYSNTAGPGITLLSSMLFCYNVDEKEKKKTILCRATVYVRCAHSPHACVGFFPGALASYCILQMCTWGELACGYIVLGCVSVSGSVLEGHPVQGGSSLVSQTASPGFGPPRSWTGISRLGNHLT